MNQSKPRILYVEDDLALSFVTKDNLELKGYEIHHCENGESAIEAYKSTAFDLAILDVMLPKVDGFAIAKKIRETNSDIPIIFLTAKSTKEDKIHGLKIGGDDYITKPYSIEELTLKIDVFLRRSKITQQKEYTTKIPIKDFTLDTENLLLKYKETERKLTLKESELLKFLVIHKNRILKREEILTKLWGNDDYFKGRSLDVFISRLRKYLATDKSIKIENIHGVGFKFKIES